MKDKIEIGDYVRTDKGIIGILTSKQLTYPEPSEWILNVNGKEEVINESLDYPVNHAEKPIDLVQEGDFVNGLEVQEFYYEDGTMLGIPIYTSDGLFNTIECWIPLEEINIKEILTKEKYNQECFKVVE